MRKPSSVGVTQWNRAPEGVGPPGVRPIREQVSSYWSRLPSKSITTATAICESSWFGEACLPDPITPDLGTWINRGKREAEGAAAALGGLDPDAPAVGLPDP